MQIKKKILKNKTLVKNKSVSIIGKGLFVFL